MRALFNQLKGIVFAMLLIIPLLLPFGQTAHAYGATDQENVIDVGKDHFVVLKEDGSVWSWGDDAYGQLGVRIGTLPSANPSAIRREDGNRLADIKSIAAGGYHTVALDRNNNVWTWGRNSSGQLGYATTTIGTTGQMGHNNNPEIVMKNATEALKAVAISAGEYHTLAVDETGQVWAWGSGSNGQIGTTGMAVSPVLVTGLSNIVAVAAGSGHSLALTKDGNVYAWGRNTSGQLGLGNGQSAHENPMPKKIDSLTNIMEIAAGDNHTLALKQDRTTIWAWGSNKYGQLGDGGREDKLSPIQVKGIQGVKMITAGNDHTIAVKDTGSVWTWGRNTSGTREVRTTPIQIKGVNSALAIGGGGADMASYTLAIDQSGMVWQWDQTSSDPTKELPIFKQVSGIDEAKKVIEYPYVQGGQVLFKYVGTSGISDVQVSGSFNNNIDIPLVRNGNEWTLQLEVPPGQHEYGFKVDGRWMADPLNRDKVNNNFGDIVSLLKVDQYAAEGPVIHDKEVTFTYNSYDFNRQLEYDAETSSVAIRASFNDWLDIPLIRQSNNTWTLTETLPAGDYVYEFIVRDRATGAVAVPRLDPLNKNRVTNPTTGNTRNTFTVSEQIITKIPVEDVALDRGDTMEMVVDEQTTLQAIISPSNATNKAVNWKSSNPSIVSVEAGKLTAHAKGTAVIFVTSIADGSKSTMITVTVEQQDGAISFPRPGYTIQDAKTGVEPNKVWYVKFSEELDITSVNANNVYVLDEHGVKVPLGYDLSNGDKTLDISLQNNDTYKLGATYYLFINDTVKTKFGSKKLKEKVQMQFQIRL